MADDSVYCGTWKIIKCMSLAWGIEASGIEGTEFTLDESGDVTWNIPENTESMPFFSCETYEVFLCNPHYLRFFGTFAGHVIEFKVFYDVIYSVLQMIAAVFAYYRNCSEKGVKFAVNTDLTWGKEKTTNNFNSFKVDQIKEDTIQLTYEGWCILQCEKVCTKETKHDLPFSFLCALEGGYFIDMSIFASNRKEFKVHQTVLQLGNPEIDWTQSPTPLDGLPEDVLYATLYYIYCECLPDTLQEDTAKDCLLLVAEIPGFKKFQELCELFLKNSALKQQITSLVTEMHMCASRIIDYFSGKANVHDGSSGMAVNGPVTNGVAEPDNLTANPAKLCYVIKQALREGAVAGAKLLILCDLFSRRKNELSREERHEIIKYCKSRLPIFMNQLHKLLDVIKQSFGSLSAGERLDIASYLVPEIEATLDSMFLFVMETKSALEQIINSSSSNSEKTCTYTEKTKKGSVGEAFGRSLKNALHMRELMKLRSFHERVTVSFMNLMHKKENFSEMTSGNKIRCVAKNLEHLIEEIPVFLMRIEELRSAVDEKLSWNEWKYLFKLGTSKLAWVLNKLICHKVTLRTMITHISELVNREQFTRTLIQLNLLDSPPLPPGQSQNQVQGNSPVASACCKSPTHSPVAYTQLGMAESLCHPPLPRDSLLAKNAVQLLKSGNDTDMKFEIVTVQDVSDTVIDHTQGHPRNHSTPEEEVEWHVIRAHCVVIASRCDWFRKALLSGMRESIDKKITIHDTNPTLFRIFLEYLYGGHLDTGQLSTEQLADLMQLSDRYEVDSLKQISEEALKDHIDDDSALFLLSIGDQFNARSLRSAALEFISMNKDIIKSEVFYELPEDLQSEVEEMITWVELRNSQQSEELSCPQYLGPGSPSSMSSSLLDIEELTSAMNISGKEGDAASDSSSLEDLPLTQDSAQLEACIAHLRDIVGQSVPREELVQISLAADFDVNRALNFFFSS